MPIARLHLSNVVHVFCVRMCACGDEFRAGGSTYFPCCDSSRGSVACIVFFCFLSYTLGRALNCESLLLCCNP